MVSRIWRVLKLAGTCLLLPAIVAHELTHYLFAHGVSDERWLEANPLPAVVVIWRSDVPTWRLRLAKLAPTIVGVAVAPIVMLWLLRGGYGFVATVLGVTLWLVYTIPSGGDLSLPVVDSQQQ